MVLITMSLIFSQIRVVLTPLEPRYCHKAFKALKTPTHTLKSWSLGTHAHTVAAACHFCQAHRPFVSLAGLVVAVALVLRVLLVDAVVGQMHELVAQSLHGRRIPVREVKSTRYSLILTLTKSTGIARRETDLQLANRTSPSEKM